VATAACGVVPRTGVSQRLPREKGSCVLAAALALALVNSPAAVEVHLALETPPHGSKAERVRIRELQYDVMARLAAAKAGAFVRDRWDRGECVLRLEGPDARRLWAAVEEPVRAYAPRAGSYALLEGTAGPPERIELGNAGATPRR
jgi:hypothetical protein